MAFHLDSDFAVYALSSAGPATNLGWPWARTF